jgi:hypothetical protein
MLPVYVLHCHDLQVMHAISKHPVVVSINN